MKELILAAVVSTLAFSAFAEDHDHQALKTGNGKPATSATIAANKAVAKTLNYADVRAFENNNRGLIASFDQATGDLIHNSFNFIDPRAENAHKAPDTVNPSLWRQAAYNQAAEGLYQVHQGLYQVRGADLASMTFIRGKTGWIAYDVLTSIEAAAQAMKFFFANVPEGKNLPIVAMIYSHSHADHFGGARAIQEAFPNVRVYGSKNITKEIVDENVLAGNAMGRRVAYQYGNTLGRNETGIVDAALAKGVTFGQITYVKPHKEMNLKGKWETAEIDGIEMIFMDASGTEAVSEMVTYIPSIKAVWTGEMMYQGMHNVYTLRGTKVRDSLKWSKDINEMINAWGDDVEILFGSHSAPIWGNSEINDYMKMQRDAYGFIHNQALRLANSGYVMQDLGDKIYEVMPESIRKSWHTNGYHGTYSHNARAVYNMYLGYFDMNPANLNPLPIKPESAKFVEYMGGASKLLAKAEKDFAKGEYRFVATALNKLVQVEPDNRKVRKLLADTYEQLGYQSESAGWRNTYLTGAQELRLGKVTPGALKPDSADIISEMDIGLLFDYLAVRVDATKAQHTPFTLSMHMPDTGEYYFIEMSNGNLNNVKTNVMREADAAIILKQSDVTRLQLGQVKLDKLLASKKAEITGDQAVLEKLMASLVEFDDSFEIVPFSEVQVDSHIYD